MTPDNKRSLSFFLGIAALTLCIVALKQWNIEACGYALIALGASGMSLKVAAYA